MVKATKSLTDSENRKQSGVGLTDKQLMFISEYIIDLNASRAAVRAGYSKKTAQVQASRLLSNVMVSDAIAIALAERRERIKMRADDVLCALGNVARTSITDVLSWQDNCIILKNSVDLSPQAAVAIQSISIKPGEHGPTISVRMHDKIKALELAGRHLGVWEKDSGDGMANLRAIFESAAAELAAEKNAL